MDVLLWVGGLVSSTQMSPSGSGKPAEIVFGILMAVVLLALPIVIWRKAIVAPYRAARQLLERISPQASAVVVRALDLGAALLEHGAQTGVLR